MGKMTTAKLDAEFRAGRGQGHGDHYLPWLYLRRRNPSPVSCQLAAHLPGSRRPHHYLSRSEYYVAFVLMWLGVQDSREQFPAWPQPHPHPMNGAPGCASGLPRSDGLLAIAADLGIPHGCYPGTAIPYVATLDLMLTLRGSPPSAAVVEVKPRVRYQGPTAAPRIIERLTLTAEYCRRLGIHHVIVERSDLPVHLVPNLEWIADGADVDRYMLPDDRLRFRDALLAALGHGESLCDATNAAASSCGLSWSLAVRALHACLWYGDVDADLSVPLRMTYPVVPGGGAVRQALATRLLGRSV